MVTSRERLIIAANQIFYLKGFSGSAVEEILKQSNVSRGTFYSYFKDKNEVIEAALHYRAKLFLTMLEDKFAQARDAEDGIELLFDGLKKWHNEHGNHGCLFYSAINELGLESIRSISQSHKKDVLRSIRDFLSTYFGSTSALLADHVMILIEGAVALGSFGDMENQIKVARSAACDAIRTRQIGEVS